MPFRKELLIRLTYVVFVMSLLCLFVALVVSNLISRAGPWFWSLLTFDFS